MKKTVKAYAVISPHGRVEYTSKDGWHFHWGVFPRKYEARDEAKPTREDYRIVPCTITYELPTTN